MKKYTLGLDVGTNSIGWAVVDENNEIVKKNGFALWGVRMMEEAHDAKERRTFRGSRRRIFRRSQRIKWLQDEFIEKIQKIDALFFQRLNDSFYKLEDKQNNNKYTFFDDVLTDKQYFNAYPTIYHLRKHLLEVDEPVDLRMLYLAVHHIIKYRGHFLNEGVDYDKGNHSQIKNNFDIINELLAETRVKFEDDEDYFEKIQIGDNFLNELENIFLNISTKNDQKSKLRQLFGVEKKTFVNEFIIQLLVGSSVNISKLTFVQEQHYEKCEIDLENEELLEKIETSKKIVVELAQLFDSIIPLKEIVDTYYLLGLIGESDYLSDAMVRSYDKHQEDLKKLKFFFKTYLSEYYNECFRKYDKKIYNYPHYIGMNSTKKQLKRFSHCTKDKFYDYLKKQINKVKDEKAEELKNEILKNIEQGDYLSRQNSGHNTVIPMQLNLMELETILKNQSKYYPFLLERDGEYTRIERIVSIFKYHLPYYVGPLNNKSPYSWVTRTNEKITPWNYEKVIDLDTTAKQFIERMQNKCTYLHGDNDYCLPKKSLLFSEYNCLQYLNRLKINGQLIKKEMKEDLFNNIFLKYSKPTRKKIEEYLEANHGYEPSSFTSKIEEITCDMSSYIKFKEIFGEEFYSKKGIIEEIIKDITIFEDKKILERRLKDIYCLDDEKIGKIKQLNYKGYATLSKKLLTDLVSVDENTGEVYGSIIQIMRNTNLNLQQILFDDKYNFMKVIDQYNKNLVKDEEEGINEFIDNHIYISPIMKRPLIQTYKLIEEIETILKQKIDYYCIECTRTNKAAKKTTSSRYNQLKEFYNECKKQADLLNKFHININKLNASLEENKDNLRQEKIYLYFTQLGKSLYTLQDIDLVKLNGKTYDIDHIYPQSLIKDDSFSNKVLVESHINQHIKKDQFICDIPNFLPPNAINFYKKLLELKLITKEKFRRLTQKEIKPEELNGFVNRQLVVTNQAVKGLIETLKLYKQVDESHIIYSKAENISDFRQKYDLLKSRTVNNYHHAHDAYLNAVIGKTLNEYYKIHYFNNQTDLERMKNSGYTINPEVILSKDRIVKRKGIDIIIWEKEETLKLIRKNLQQRFDIHETIRSYCSNEMFKKTSIIKNGNVPIKTTDKRCNLEKYGGITSYAYSKYCIVELIDKKQKKCYILEAIPKVFENSIEKYIQGIITPQKYTSFKIVHDCIKTNVVIMHERKKYCITGKSGENYLIKNLLDRNFSYHFTKIIKCIEKYNNQSRMEIPMDETRNKIIVAPSSDKKEALTISMDDCLYALNEIKKAYSKNIYSYGIIETIVDKLNHISELSLKEYIQLVIELLKLLKTNTRETADLRIIDMKEKTGLLTMGKVLKPGMKFISESITGYYRKILFEVPSGV
ncbi:MAG: type II CRISPR RNA-guided endonuclease Cas9 [Prevotella sp.]|nr:type II CRISPR RNA-guided endonuclease Cas9 [Staphylococcus sp.]MCM1350669.1 type II CRISPR RNA-guided endonuclease Cas9 [Prevotella sp.]